jgi:hypothetical protein
VKYIPADEGTGHPATRPKRAPLLTIGPAAYFSILKRSINGVYHHVGRRRLHIYPSEFGFCWNSLCGVTYFAGHPKRFWEASNLQGLTRMILREPKTQRA